MAKMIEFMGLKHYALGNANLELIDDQLKVSNIGNSGCDGFSVLLHNVDRFEAQFKPFDISFGKSYSVTNFGRDSFGRNKVINQISVGANEDEGFPIFISVNSKLLPKNVNLYGLINSINTFQGELVNPERDPCINWWPIILGAIYVANKIDLSRTMVYDVTGKLIGYEDTVSWGGRTASEGDIFTTPKGAKFRANNFYIKYSDTFNAPIPIELATRLSEMQFVGTNLGEIFISNELYSPMP